MKLTDILDEARLAASGLVDFASGIAKPNVRLGITGLSRAGKTVFITALVNNILNNASLALFEAQARGRIKRAYLEPQPDDHLPRFSYEQHLASLTGTKRSWPESTRRISQLRLTIEYEPVGLIARNTHGGRLHIDIVDYPGEWLLDLPLMGMTYQQWSDATVGSSHLEPRKSVASEWHAELKSLSHQDTASEAEATRLAAAFTEYLSKCRSDNLYMSALPPGRFLMPGDLEGSPLLTFSPLELPAHCELVPGSIGAMMARRFDAYVSKVVKPFFFSHFARIDRQVVLVDVLSALNAGASSVIDLKSALTDILSCFRQGPNTIFSELFGRKIDKLVFVATKADLLHHSSHNRLDAILTALVAEAEERANAIGAHHHSVAIAAIRATREATVRVDGEDLPVIVGIPNSGETINGKSFDGEVEAAVYPGELPEDATQALTGELAGKLKFVKFRPPTVEGHTFPNIRLDRVVEFILGDKFE